MLSMKSSRPPGAGRGPSRARRGALGVVVRRDAHRHQVEAGVEERQPLGVGDDVGGVVHALLDEKSTRRRQHAWREICHGDTLDVRGDGERGMPAAGRDVERAVRGSGLRPLDENGEVVARAVALAGDVGLGGCAEGRAHPLFDRLSLGVLGWLLDFRGEWRDEFEPVAKGIEDEEALDARDGRILVDRYPCRVEALA